MSYDAIERREEVLSKYSENLEGHEFEYITVKDEGKDLAWQVCKLCHAIKGTHLAWRMCQRKNIHPEARHKVAVKELEGLREKRRGINTEICLKLQEIEIYKREMEALKVES